ncbi:APC family permease [Agrococcus jejuensis]|uniref:Amino acid transporter n=1 Tax=Agrococcus jejuensis TaxID=399736 RepID=A0A1G8CWR4_9MICO|nr:APC family permease [Agrococcus jejuensis]SDH49925.1 Amino acid transporter [Agrococcus jejuensis]
MPQRSTDRPTRLKRVLGLPALIAYGMASMGILAVFTVYGSATRLSDGHLPAAYVLAVVAMLFTAKSYGRLARSIANAGSAYTYTSKAFGRIVGFFTGWVMLLDYLFLPMINFLLIGLYMNSVLPEVPAQVFTMAGLALVLALNVIGVQWVEKLNYASVASAALIVAVFVVLAFTRADALTPDILLAPFLPGGDGLGPIVAGAAVVALAFLGFDGVSTLAEETRDPQRNIPRGILLSTLFVGIGFIVVAWASSVLVPDWTQLTNLDAAGTELMERVGGTALTTAFLVVYIIATILCGTAAQMSVSRVLFAMGRDGLLPRPIARLHRRFRTPYVAALVVSAFSLVALFITLDAAVYMINFGALVAFAMVNLSVVKHFWVDRRVRGRGAVVTYLLLPLVGFAFIAWLFTSLAPFTYVLGVAWLAVGAVVFGLRTSWFRSEPPALEFDERVDLETSETTVTAR